MTSGDGHGSCVSVLSANCIHKVWKYTDLHHVRRRGATPLWSTVLLVDNVGAIRTSGNEGGVGKSLPGFAAIDPRTEKQEIIFVINDGGETNGPTLNSKRTGLALSSPALSTPLDSCALAYRLGFYRSAPVEKVDGVVAATPKLVVPVGKRVLDPAVSSSSSSSSVTPVAVSVDPQR